MNLCKTCGTICPFDDEHEKCDAYSPLTNEQWFCQLPTYKKAILMANCYDAFNLDQYACNKHVVIEEWLKKPHSPK